ncbi:MAG: tRNA epoxyqueuosine(34) reductase QueG [Planctomycetota bacterium]|nr:tRNA epoxyqueuosine(34) reductase QueG [Planctomycetota bacterium]
MTDPHQIASEIKSQARALGFDLVGIAPAEPSRYRDYFRHWLDDGRAGDMTYLANRFHERTDPARYLPGAASVICAAINYHVPLQPIAPSDQPHHGKIARYALADDYHHLLKPRLHTLCDSLRQQAPDAKTRAAVDTAPVLEKELAARANIGWIAKNTCIINERIGSWLLLGEIITTLALPPDTPAIDRCGTCTRCIDACPTHAITAPYELDPRRCISYLTIEHRDDIPHDLHLPIHNWLYGCDICQDVCPWNRHAPTSTDPALQPRFPTGSLDLRQLLTWNDQTYRSSLHRSAIKRTKLPLLHRNAAIIRTQSEKSEQRGQAPF